MSDVVTNREILDLLETEGSLDYLLLEYGVDPDTFEDEYLADLCRDVIPLLEDIHARLDLTNPEREDDNE